MVKDHRTSAETGNVDAVMDGALDPFINAYLKWINTKEPSGLTTALFNRTSGKICRYEVRGCLFRIRSK